MTEILRLGCAVVVPYASSHDEQLIRASLLESFGLIRMIHPAQLSPQSLLKGLWKTYLRLFRTGHPPTSVCCSWGLTLTVCSTSKIMLGGYSNTVPLQSLIDGIKKSTMHTIHSDISLIPAISQGRVSPVLSQIAAVRVATVL